MSLGRASRALFAWRGSVAASSLRAGACGAWGKPLLPPINNRRELSHVPVDDLISGLTEEQIQVSN